MLMRYRGGGVGHRSIRDVVKPFLDDRDALDSLMGRQGKSDVEMNVGEIEGKDSPAESDEDIEMEFEGEDLDEMEHDESGERPEDADSDMEEEMNEFGYSGVAEEDDGDDKEDGDLDNGGDEALGPEDGEDDDVTDLHGFAEL